MSGGGALFQEPWVEAWVLLRAALDTVLLAVVALVEVATEVVAVVEALGALGVALAGVPQPGQQVIGEHMGQLPSFGLHTMRTAC